MKTHSNAFLFGIAIISAMGGLLFGYDWVVIGGAKPFYEQFFGIADNIISVSSRVVSIGDTALRFTISEAIFPANLSSPYS